MKKIKSRKLWSLIKFADRNNSDRLFLRFLSVCFLVFIRQNGLVILITIKKEIPQN